MGVILAQDLHFGHDDILYSKVEAMTGYLSML